ncbi:MAG: hypothetical protein M1838_002983 [Thelocarpon superellum]|nr:MAG: hypothetical protein M1838_002983 [Thelocarpon superellum]
MTADARSTAVPGGLSPTTAAPAPDHSSPAPSMTPSKSHNPSVPATSLKSPRPAGRWSKSATASPRSSREASPIRPSIAGSGLRSQPQSHDPSPTHISSNPPLGSATHIPSVPSAAAVQRALSTANITVLPPPVQSEPAAQPSKLPKVASADALDTVPHWPTSPRLKSPPPGRTPSHTPRKIDAASPTAKILVQRPQTVNHASASNSTSDTDGEESASPLVMRSSARGVSATSSTLETVQEGSVPSDAPGDGPRSRRNGRVEEEWPEKITENPVEEAAAAAAAGGLQSVTESGSDSGGNKGEEREKVKNGAAAGARSKTGGGTIKGKGGSEAAMQSMTVETETVSSIPQVAVGGGDRAGSNRIDGASVRLKPSTETIRPKKEKKKTMRKAPSVNAGTGTSKADVFEAKVASAVDEANSSDSEETFVYESNPPEPRPIRPRHHSRTPSATSIQSQMDPHPPRSGPRGGGNGTHSVGGKRSMKFVHNPYPAGVVEEDGGSGDNAPTAARGSGRGTGTAHHHHHQLGHGGRPGRGQHTSLFDSESPFPQNAKALRSGSGYSPRRSSRPSSPRTGPHWTVNGSSGKKAGPVESYNIDLESASADEDTPLMGSVRISRSRAHRGPGGSSLRQAEYQQETRQRRCLAWSVGCLGVGFLVLLVVLVSTAVLFALSKTLRDVRVEEIQNVLASEQEIMLDLVVAAVNPNFMAVSISEMDVNVFAKSRYVGSDTLQLQPQPAGIDEGNDPIEDPGGDPQTMLLGRIFRFDSAPSLEGSPFQHARSMSVGEVRLAKPGNKTEEGGTARWERVIQHPFELIVRGVLKYQLLMPSPAHSASIGASVLVHPEDGVDHQGRMNVTHITDAPYAPGSNVAVIPRPKAHS